MKIYKYGKIVSVGKSYVIFESNYSGSIVYVARPEQFTKDENLKLYVYKYETEYSVATYGFRDFTERLLFEDLISISGVGPKSAVGLLKEGKDVLIKMIVTSDVEGLASFPYIGSKSANQIVFELSSKYSKMNIKKNNKALVMPSDAKASLKTLGFNQKQIDFAIRKLKPQENIETLVEKAIRVISNEKTI